MQQKRTSPWKLVSVALFIAGLGIINVFQGHAALALAFGITLMTAGIALLVLRGFR